MRIPKKYGERTLRFDKTQDEKPKYILIYEGQQTEVQYFDGVIDNREELMVNPLIDLLPVLRSTFYGNNSHPLRILDYIENHMENYRTVEMVCDKIVDYCSEEGLIKENGIYNLKDFRKDIIEYFNKQYINEKGNKFEVTLEDIKGLSKYVEGKVNILTQIDSIKNYIDEQEIIYNKDIDKICLIIDRDCGNVKSNQYDEILDKCIERNIKLYVSNPDFEFWLLLHSNNINNYDKNDMLENRKEKTKSKKRFLEVTLAKEFGGYKKKNIKFDNFKPHINLAINQEKDYCENNEELKTQLGSNVGILLTEIMKQQ